MQLADGRKTLKQIRDGKAQSVAQLRAESSSLRSEENDPGEEEIGCPDENKAEQGKQAERAVERIEAAILNQEKPDEYARNRAHYLVKFLIDQATREAAIKMVLAGSQAQFVSATQAVADFYQQLAKAGR